MDLVKENKEELQVIYDNDQITLSARELHEFLEVKTKFKDWFPRMVEYGFKEGTDFNFLKNEQVQKEGNREVVRKLQDYQLTIEMAKEISMLQRNERGKYARKYFLEIEKRWNSPEFIMDRALKISKQRVENLKIENLQIKAENSKLLVETETLRPKADYFDELVDRNLLTNIRDTAKELKVKQTDFVNFLVGHKYLYRNSKGKLLPYAAYNNDLFEIKETMNSKTDWVGQQTMITPKGRETFKLLMN